MKKILIVIILGIVGTVVFLEGQLRLPQRDSCAFCDEKVLENQIVFENAYALGLINYRPIVPGHMLVIPKRHVQTFEELTETELLHMMRMIKKVDEAVKEVYGTTSYILLQKNGKEAGQTVPHVHFHYIPKKEGDYSVLPLLFRIYTSPFHSTLSFEEMEKTRLTLARTKTANL